MITRLLYNNKKFKILNQYSIKSSNNEVTFNDIVIDFTGGQLEDLPFKYQEINIVVGESEEDILNGIYQIVFTGYLDGFNFSSLKNANEDRELTLTLLSPMTMATKRYVSLIGTFEKTVALTRILQPLIDDGFTIKECNIPKGQIATNFILETVENCMNYLCCKLNILWYIDENKNIYINSIEYLFGLGAKKTITSNTREKGWLKIQPKIENIDYANVINFKNVRVYYRQHDMKDISRGDFPIIDLPKKLKKGDTVTFNNPIIINEDVLKRIIDNDSEEIEQYNNHVYYLLFLNIMNENTYENKYVSISMASDRNDETSYKKVLSQGDFSYSNDSGTEATIVLQRDSFFSNMITGFKWNGEDDWSIYEIMSNTALRYTTMRFMYSPEIEKLKGIISKTGIIEKTIDYNNQWTLTSELIDYAKSLMTENSKEINQVELEYDQSPNLRIGDLVKINAPEFYINGQFAVKEITHTFQNDIEQDWKIVLKNSDFNSTYIDLFRTTQSQEEENKINTIILSEFVEEEIVEKHSIEEETSEN